MPEHVSVRGLSVRYGRGRTATDALASTDLDIAAGSFVAIVGPSGCGKSTLLRALAGLVRPTSGSIAIGERSPRDYVAAHRLGMAFQDHALLPWLSVRDNIALPFALAKRPTDRARVDALLALVGLEAFAGARPRELSGGMRQRASIARALVLDPDLVLLDEPFGALDAVTRRQLNLEVQRVWGARPVTTVLVTHGIDEAVFLADRVIVMSPRPGRPIADVAIDLPRPRTRAVLADPAFHRIADAITQTLDDAMTP